MVFIVGRSIHVTASLPVGAKMTTEHSGDDSGDDGAGDDSGDDGDDGNADFVGGGNNNVL